MVPLRYRRCLEARPATSLRPAPRLCLAAARGAEACKLAPTSNKAGGRPPEHIPRHLRCGPTAAPLVAHGRHVLCRRPHGSPSPLNFPQQCMFEHISPKGCHNAPDCRFVSPAAHTIWGMHAHHARTPCMHALAAGRPGVAPADSPQGIPPTLLSTSAHGPTSQGAGHSASTQGFEQPRSTPGAPTERCLLGSSSCRRMPPLVATTTLTTSSWPGCAPRAG